jgi:uncharacterized protein YdhG (YjbR/CyaY superfamily)
LENGKDGPASIDEYINSCPQEVRSLLLEIRSAIKAEAPDATEKISYQMPTFFLKGNLVHFAAFKNHIGFYPTPSGITAFDGELARYRSGKGSVQFPLGEPLPIELIRKIVRFRIQENLEAAARKARKGK